MQALPECEATRWNPLFTDVVPVGGNKSIGMEKILAYFGISREETMAFGDGGNDIPMLEYAGIGWLWEMLPGRKCSGTPISLHPVSTTKVLYMP